MKKSSQTNRRSNVLCGYKIDNVTSDIIQSLVDYLKVVDGRANNSAAVTKAIRSFHKQIFPERWNGPYFIDRDHTKPIDIGSEHVGFRLDEDTIKMVDEISDHYVFTEGASDNSLVVRRSIRNYHRLVLPNECEGLYYLKNPFHKTA